MPEESTFNDMRQRAAAAPYSDGLLDLFMAALFAVIAAVWAAARGELLALLSIPLILAGGYGLREVKRRVTEPRIGFAGPRKPEPSSGWGNLIFFGTAVVILVAVVVWSGDVGVLKSWMRWAPFLSGYLVAGAFWYLADSSGAVRYRLMAGFSVAVGLVVSLVGDGSSYESMAVFFGVMAVSMGAMGGVTLLVFLRRHPLDNGEAE